MDIECRTCGAQLVLEAHVRTAVCPYCASPAVVERPPAPGRPTPLFVIGFALTQEAASIAVRDWLGRRGFFTKSSVKQGRIDSIRGVYLPAYLYSALAQSNYRAEIGEDYQETETYTTTDSQGNTVTRTRTVTRTEYRTLQGNHATYVMDVIVTASRSVNNAELEAVEPFDLRTMRRYSPALLSGWIAEEPTMAPAECAALARQEALGKIGQELAAFMPGDSHRALWYQTALDRESADLVCLPLWVLAIRHAPNEPPFRMLINGQTGKIYGKAPLSWVKILLAVLIALALLATPFILGAVLGDDADDGPSRRGGRSDKATPTAAATATAAPSAPATTTSGTRTPTPGTRPTATATRTATATKTTTATKTATTTPKPTTGTGTGKKPGGRAP